MRRWTVRLAAGGALVLATLVVVRAFDARRMGPLKPWHTVVPESELRAAELDGGFDLPRYLAREEAVFREVASRVEAAVAPVDRDVANRYWTGSPLSPSRLPGVGNRTFELAPEDVRGGVLLLHGLTDAPYSMRRLAEIYRELGYYTLALRLPGHGTVPAALTEATWRDWAAAVRVGARHVRSRTGAGAPFHVVGYSNGGALAVDYALDVLGGARLPRPDRLVLVSPMIGVAPSAAFARALGALGVFPYFRASRWLEVAPEYNPFKYGSFPVNAAAQTAALTGEVRGKMARAGEAGRLGALPPILAFVSLVDATVRTDATVHDLFESLPANGSALVVFDVNRAASVRPFLKRREVSLLEVLLPPRARRYRLSVVTNASDAVSDVVEQDVPAGSVAPLARPLGLAWPRQVYSLSHVALPFPPDDPLYGGEPSSSGRFRVHLGTLQPRGEKAVLSVPVEQLMRLTWNPFFPLLEERVREWAAIPADGAGGPAGRSRPE